MTDDPAASADAAAAAKQEKSLAAEAAGAKPIMHVKVYSPFRIYFDEDAYSLSGENETGPFDILPHHHNFMSLLGACELSIRPVITPPFEQRIKISGGLMHVKADQITVFLDI